MPQSYAYQSANFSSFLSSSLQIGLFSQSPLGNGVGVELSGVNAPGYARQAITLSPVLNMCASNTGAISWTATGAWATALFFGIFLASTGDLIYWGALPGSGFLTSQSGGTPTIPAGALLIDWTNPAMGAAANWGPFVGITPIAAPAAISIINSMAWNTELEGMSSMLTPVGSGIAIPRDAGVAQFLNMMPDQTLGSYLYFNVIDATRGTTAGFSVAGPNALAF
jgi:hypothetical protein